jgi:hypothetical protein
MKSSRIESFNEFCEREEPRYAAEFEDWLKRERGFERMQREGKGALVGIRNGMLMSLPFWALLMWGIFR